MKKATFFSKSDEIDEITPTFNRPIEVEKNDNEKNIYRRKESAIINKDIIKYVIDNFPPMSLEIRNALINLIGTLENTIDYIEDSSSYIIKTERNFKLSEVHRNTSIAIYDVVKNIDAYVNWMKKELEDNEETEKIDMDTKSNEKEILLEKEIIDDLKNEEILEIYKDFSYKEPKAFKVDDILIEVENWDDLLVKLAEVLVKKYRDSKNSDKIVNSNVEIFERKSTQNAFRDSVVDMLNEYKINLNDFKVIIKK